MGGNPISKVLYCVSVCVCVCVCARAHVCVCVCETETEGDWLIDYQEQEQLLLESYCVVQMSCLDQSNESINGSLY